MFLHSVLRVPLTVVVSLVPLLMLPKEVNNPAQYTSNVLTFSAQSTSHCRRIPCSAPYVASEQPCTVHKQLLRVPLTVVVSLVPLLMLPVNNPAQYTSNVLTFSAQSTSHCRRIPCSAPYVASEQPCTVHKQCLHSVLRVPLTVVVSLVPLLMLPKEVNNPAQYTSNVLTFSAQSTSHCRRIPCSAPYVAKGRERPCTVHKQCSYIQCSEYLSLSSYPLFRSLCCQRK
ncbi:hypothetical protein J6590_082296 [Homalodisca vitripennis]|nr:hypothetical protein J6590_082296 [Homalodisca vitripennis]